MTGTTDLNQAPPQADRLPNGRRIRLAFLIRSLGTGGAETQMVALAKALDKSRFDVSVIVFYDEGEVRADLASAGIPMFCVEKRGRWDVIGFLLRTLRQIKALRPDIVHGYMGTANVVLSVLKPALGRTAIVWGIRRAYAKMSDYDWVSRIGFPVECFFSRFADLIIANSRSGRDYHIRYGFPGRRFIVIPNGVDTDRFRPDPASGARVRAGWGVSPDVKLIGFAARLDPAKDHPTFLKAAAMLLERRKDVRFVCIGDTSGPYGAGVLSLAEELGLSDHLMWAGPRRDMPAVYNALDLSTLTSRWEGLPNVVLEAMACGVPCVSTDVGDAAWVVGDTGAVVPAGDADAIAGAWQMMLERIEGDRERLGAAARNRATGCFSIENLKRTTEEALQQLCDQKARR